MRFIRFWHKVFKPNCDCEVCSTPACENCEQLQTLLASEKATNARLVDTIINFHKPIVAESSFESKPEELKPIGNSFRSWSIQRRMLEEEDMAKAKIIKKKAEEELKAKMDTAGPSVEEIEKSLEEESVG